MDIMGDIEMRSIADMEDMRRRDTGDIMSMVMSIMDIMATMDMNIEVIRDILVTRMEDTMMKIVIRGRFCV